jgi:hypothetical protein
LSESPDRERWALEEIEQRLSSQDPRLARLLREPGWWARWRWGRNREWLVALILLAVLSMCSMLLSLLH